MPMFLLQLCGASSGRFPSARMSERKSQQEQIIFQPIGGYTEGTVIQPVD